MFEFDSFILKVRDGLPVEASSRTQPRQEQEKKITSNVSSYLMNTRIHKAFIERLCGLK